MILVTGCNAGYLPQMMPYLDTLRHHADFPVYFVGVGFKPPGDGDKIRRVALSHEQNAGAPPQTESIQHGSFLPVIDCAPDDVILYTDGDFIMQRPMNEGERAFFDFSGNTATAGWNGRDGETLKDEYHRLGPGTSLEDMPLVWGDNWYELPIYNAGALALTAEGWQVLHDAYMQYWPSVCETFHHQARQQWLISWILGQCFDVKIMPWSIHAHGHHGLKPGMNREAHGVTVDGKLALFRHFI